MSRGRGKRKEGEPSENANQVQGSEPGSEAAAPSGGTVVEGTIPLDTRETDGEVIDPAGVDLTALQAGKPAGLSPELEARVKEFTEKAQELTQQKEDGLAMVSAPTAADVAAAVATIPLGDLIKPEVKTVTTQAEPKTVAVVEPITDTPVAVPGERKLRFSTPDPDLEPISLHHAATSMLSNYQPYWLNGIRLKGQQFGIHGDMATRQQWRAVFMAWGGPDILRDS